MKIETIEKPPPNNLILKVTSSTLEEKQFLDRLYDSRSIPVSLSANPDGSVTVIWTF